MDQERWSQIEKDVDEMFERSDAKVFEILHRIAKLAVEQTVETQE